MQIKKTVGQPGEHGKDYVVHTECGLQFLVERNAGSSTYSQFEYGIQKSTLSEIKKVIEQSESPPFEENSPEENSPEENSEPENFKTIFEQGPRAASLLALLHVGEHVAPELIRECLDNAGYVDPETREIAVDTAKRDVERFTKKDFQNS